MAKNVSTPKSMDRAASDSAPSGMRKMDPAPGGGMVRNIKGPSIHNTNTGGDLKNSDGIDKGTSVESS